MTAVLLAVAGLVAVGDWLAVYRRLFRIEYLLKPATLALLVAAAVSADVVHPVKPWLVAALVFGLCGDVALMRSDPLAERPDLPFMLGLGAFLIGHVCYLAAFARYGLHGLHAVAGVLVVGGVAVLSLPRVLAGARRAGGQELMAIVGVYAATLAAMAILAVATGQLATAAGGVLFLISDTLIARQRFVARIKHGDLAVIVSYHAAQALILIGLLHSWS